MNFDNPYVTRSRMVSRLLGWLVKYRVPIVVFATTRLGLFILVCLSLMSLPVREGEGLWRVFPDNTFLDGWFRWDAGWYNSIVEHGYSNLPKPENGQRDTTFWPLYPVTVRTVKLVVGNPFVAAFMVSNIAFLVSLILLFRITKRRYGADIGTKVVMLISIWPFSFYFSAYYTEALYLLACVAAFYFGENRRWALAGLCAAAAGATRLLGCLSMVGLTLLYLEQIQFKVKGIRSDFCWIFLGLIGPLGFVLFLWLEFGEPFVFYWGRNVPGWAAGVSMASLFNDIGDLFWGRIAMTEINILFGLLGLAMVIFTWRKVGIAYSVWAIIGLLAAFFNYVGLGRYVAPIFPVFISGAILLSTEGRFLAWAFLSTLLLALFSIMYSHWYWVT